MLLGKIQLKGLKNISKYLSMCGIFLVILNITIIITYAQPPHEYFHSSWPSEIVWYYNSNTGFTYGVERQLQLHRHSDQRPLYRSNQRHNNQGNNQCSDQFNQ